MEERVGRVGYLFYRMNEGLHPIDRSIHQSIIWSIMLVVDGIALWCYVNIYMMTGWHLSVLSSMALWATIFMGSWTPSSLVTTPPPLLSRSSLTR